MAGDLVNDGGQVHDMAAAVLDFWFGLTGEQQFAKDDDLDRTIAERFGATRDAVLRGRAEGWRKLTRNWALFFVAMAALNEAVWRNTNWDFWVGFKLWGAIPLTLLFAFANIPMLLRHGLNTSDDPQAGIPPE